MHQPNNSIGKPWDVEIDQQTDRDIQELHITQKLCLMDRQQPFNRLRFDQNAPFDQNIEAERLLSSKTLVVNSNKALGFGLNLADFQLSEQAPLIDRLDQARALVFVDFDRRRDDVFG